MTTASLRDLARLIARIGLGVIFVAHGWQKFSEYGPDGTAASFQRMGIIPLPTLSAWFAAVVELAGGVCMVVGLAAPVAGLLLALNMLGAFLLVHAGNGIFISGNGFELVLALGAGALMFAATGAGRFSRTG